MKIPTITVTCDVCGGEGEMDFRGIPSLYQGGHVSHKNPEVCIHNLKKMKDRLKELEAKNPQ